MMLLNKTYLKLNNALIDVNAISVVIRLDNYADIKYCVNMDNGQKFCITEAEYNALVEYIVNNAEVKKL